jgi:hypothetical protein
LTVKATQHPAENCQDAASPPEPTKPAAVVETIDE